MLTFARALNGAGIGLVVPILFSLVADLVMRERQQTPRIGHPQQLCARSGVHVKTDLNAGIV